MLILGRYLPQGLLFDEKITMYLPILGIALHLQYTYDLRTYNMAFMALG